ncbi:hypothetical protein ACFC0E_29885, partial [Streptomyces sp. NPDC056190]
RCQQRLTPTIEAAHWLMIKPFELAPNSAVADNFTTEDLASLQPGQVWADNRAMSTKDFDELVDDKC